MFAGKKALLTGLDLAMPAPLSGYNLQSHQIGATYYMAPEQSEGSISEKSDQYALGAIAYELCTGRRLKDANSLVSSSRRPRPPRQFNPALSAQVDRAILRAVSISPNLRYDGVNESHVMICSSCLEEIGYGPVSTTYSCRNYDCTSRNSREHSPIGFLVQEEKKAQIEPSTHEKCLFTSKVCRIYTAFPVSLI